jgi:NAD-dependent deacetylase
MSQPVDRVALALALAADVLRRARHAVVLTGAGVSTPSGLPDFRSEGSGLWAQAAPAEVASLSSFREHPERFFLWFRSLAGQIFSARPNPAHLALASLEDAGRVEVIITQNVDGLHQKAGSRHVIETHGSLRTLTCTRCFLKTESDAYVPAYLETGRTPHCPQCGSVLKPDVILFGEQLPQRAWRQSEAACRACDLILVAGSSLEVMPCAGLPLTAIEHGARLIILNQAPTYLDARADISLASDVATALPAIADLVLHG